MKTAASGSLLFAAEQGLLQVLRTLDDFVEPVVAKRFNRRQTGAHALGKLPNEAEGCEQEKHQLPECGVVSANHIHEKGVDHRDERGDQHHWETCTEELIEGNRIAGLLRETCRHDVGRSTDEGPVTAKTSAEGEGPNDGL